MKTVMAVQHGKLAIISVPDDWMQCSILRDWFPPEDYMQDGVIKRTNCIKTYMMPYDQYVAVGETADKVWHAVDTDSVMLRDKYSKIMKEINFLAACKSMGMTKAQLIAALENIPDDAVIVMEQSGYYAQGQLAELFNPQPCKYGEQKVEDMTNGFPCFVIGHSSQEY